MRRCACVFWPTWNARIPMQIDIGFGDAVVPGPSLVRLPSILDFPPPELQGYSRESIIAEKLQAMVYLGAINSRMKDFYDIWLLATCFDFEGTILARAISETFHRRRTAFPTAPVAFSDTFAQDREKQAQWVAFIRRHHIGDSPTTLHEAVQLMSDRRRSLLCPESKSPAPNWSGPASTTRRDLTGKAKQELRHEQQATG